MKLDCQVGLEPLDLGQEGRERTGIRLPLGQSRPAGKGMEHVDEVAVAGEEVSSRLKTDDVDATRRVADDLAKRHAITTIIHNAGLIRPASLSDVRLQDLDALVNLHLSAAILLAQAALPAMRAAGYGRVVLVSSRAALGLATRTAYSATKAALIGMARAHALKLGPHGITVNCLAPGPVATDLPMNILTDEQKQSFAERTAVKRWGQPIDMVGPALLLATDAGAFITGNVIVADGGLLCRTF